MKCIGHGINITEMLIMWEIGDEIKLVDCTNIYIENGDYWMMELVLFSCNLRFDRLAIIVSSCIVNGWL